MLVCNQAWRRRWAAAAAAARGSQPCPCMDAGWPCAIAGFVCGTYCTRPAYCRMCVLAKSDAHIECSERGVCSPRAAPGPPQSASGRSYARGTRNAPLRARVGGRAAPAKPPLASKASNQRPEDASLADRKPPRRARWWWWVGRERAAGLQRGQAHAVHLVLGNEHLHPVCVVDDAVTPDCRAGGRGPNVSCRASDAKAGLPGGRWRQGGRQARSRRGAPALIFSMPLMPPEPAGLGCLRGRGPSAAAAPRCVTGGTHGSGAPLNMKLQAAAPAWLVTAPAGGPSNAI